MGKLHTCILEAKQTEMKTGGETGERRRDEKSVEVAVTYSSTVSLSFPWITFQSTKNTFIIQFLKTLISTRLDARDTQTKSRHSPRSQGVTKCHGRLPLDKHFQGGKALKRANVPGARKCMH